MSGKWLEVDAGWAGCLAAACFLSVGAARQQDWRVSWVYLLEGWYLAWWACLPLLLVGWVSVSLLAAMGSCLSVAALSLLHPCQQCRHLV